MSALNTLGHDVEHNVELEVRGGHADGTKSFIIFFGHGQIKMMTRIDRIPNAQRREWRRLKVEVVRFSST